MFYCSIDHRSLPQLVKKSQWYRSLQISYIFHLQCNACAMLKYRFVISKKKMKGFLIYFLSVNLKVFVINFKSRYMKKILIWILCNHLINWTNKTSLKKSFIPSRIVNIVFPFRQSSNAMRFSVQKRFELKQSFMVTPALFSWMSWFIMVFKRILKKYFTNPNSRDFSISDLKLFPVLFFPLKFCLHCTRLKKQVKLPCDVSLKPL